MASPLEIHLPAIVAAIAASVRTASSPTAYARSGIKNNMMLHPLSYFRLNSAANAAIMAITTATPIPATIPKDVAIFHTSPRHFRRSRNDIAKQKPVTSSPPTNANPTIHENGNVSDTASKNSRMVCTSNCVTHINCIN